MHSTEQTLLDLPAELISAIFSYFSTDDLRKLIRVNRFFKASIEDILQTRKLLFFKSLDNTQPKYQLALPLDRITLTRLTEHYFIARGTNKINAYDLESKSLRWSYKINSTDTINFIHVSHNHVIYMRQTDPKNKTAYFVNIESGTVTNEFTFTSAQGKFLNIQLTNKEMIAFVEDHGIICIDIAAKTISHLPDQLSMYSEFPYYYASEKYLAVLEDHFVEFAHRETHAIEHLPIKGKKKTAALLDNKLIILSADEIDNAKTYFTIVDFVAGRIIKESTLTLNSNCSDAIANQSHLFFETDNGKIYALDLVTDKLTRLYDTQCSRVHTLTLKDNLLFVQIRFPEKEFKTQNDIVICDVNQLAPVATLKNEQTQRFIGWSRNRLFTTTSKEERIAQQNPTRHLNCFSY